MNNDKISRLSNHQIFLYFPLFQSNPLEWKDSKSTNEKVSGPDLLNHDYIRYSDIQI